MKIYSYEHTSPVMRDFGSFRKAALLGLFRSVLARCTTFVSVMVRPHNCATRVDLDEPHS